MRNLPPVAKWVLSVALFWSCIAMVAMTVNGILEFQTSTYVDLAEISAPSSPSTGYLRPFGELSTGYVACLNPSGGACLPTGATSGYVLLESHSASSSSSLDFTTCISGSYQTYKLVVLNLIPSATAFLEIRVSTDGGMNYETSNYSTIRSGMSTAAGGSGDGETAAASIRADNQTWDTTSGWGINGTIKLYSPGGSSFKQIHGRLMGITDGAPVRAAYDFFGVWEQTTAINAFRIYPDTGVWTSGTVQCYGLTQ